jgi:hypothetical protein
LSADQLASADAYPVEFVAALKAVALPPSAASVAT